MEQYIYYVPLPSRRHTYISSACRKKTTYTRIFGGNNQLLQVCKDETNPRILNSIRVIVMSASQAET